MKNTSFLILLSQHSSACPSELSVPPRKCSHPNCHHFCLQSDIYVTHTIKQLLLFCSPPYLSDASLAQSRTHAHYNQSSCSFPSPIPSTLSKIPLLWHSLIQGVWALSMSSTCDNVFSRLEVPFHSYLASDIRHSSSMSWYPLGDWVSLFTFNILSMLLIYLSCLHSQLVLYFEQNP